MRQEEIAVINYLFKTLNEKLSTFPVTEDQQGRITEVEDAIAEGSSIFHKIVGTES